MTFTRENQRKHVERGYLLVEQIHAADRQRLVERWGRVSPATMRTIEDRLRIVLDL